MNLPDSGAASNSGALFVDLYELTMMQAYLREGLTEPAVFSLFTRRLPACRNYLIACGLDSVLQFIEDLRFAPQDISYLASLGLFAEDFLDWLRRFRFHGDIYAIPEGTPVFANEPLLEVVASLPEAQFLETIAMNQIHLQTVLASKAARVVNAAKGRRVIDFGARRMHGTDAAIKAARAFHIAGVDGTSNLAAACKFGIPAVGTMGHSYIQAHDNEAEAFRAFARFYPNTILLIDTYDTLQGARRVIELAKKNGDELKISGVRLDSGDLGDLARQVRYLLDGAGLRQVQIVASGGLDEIEVEQLVQTGAPIDCFGIGTSMGVSADAPGLDIAYKLTEYAGKGRLKLSAGKATLPGRKQVFRHMVAGTAAGDVIARHDETRPGAPLLRCVMKDGRRTPAGFEPLSALRDRTRHELAQLPPALLSLAPATAPYRIEISAELATFEEKSRHAIMASQI